MARLGHVQGAVGGPQARPRSDHHLSLSGGIGTIGTHDTYNGSSLGDQASTLTSSLSIATPGFYTLTMTNSTRNASNTTGWDMTPQVLTFTRTGS